MSADSDIGPRERAAVVVVLGIALTLRLFALTWAPPMEGDSAEYVALAGHLAAAGTFSADGSRPSTYRPPLYPALLAILDRSGAPMPAAALLVQCVIGTATVLATYALARNAFGPGVALAAAAALAAAPMSVRYCATLLTETTFTFLIVTACAAWTARRPWIAGIGIGLAALARAALAPFIPALGGLGLLAHRRSAIRIALAAAVVVSPWIVRNVKITGRMTVADAGWGSNLLFGSTRLHAGSNPWAQLLDGPLQPTAADQYAAEQGARAEALRRIRRAPGEWLITRARQYPWLFLDNGVYLPLRANDIAFRQAVAEHRWATVAVKGGFVLGNAGVLAAALAGAWRHRSRWASLMPVWAVPAYIAATHLPMYVEPRYGLPLEPFLLILAAAAFVNPISPGADRVLL